SVGPNGFVVSVLGHATITLSPMQASVIGVSPTRLAAATANSASITISGIKDQNGNSVPDGTQLGVTASTSQTSFVQDSTAGSIAGFIQQYLHDCDKQCSRFRWKSHCEWDTVFADSVVPG